MTEHYAKELIEEHEHQGRFIVSRVLGADAVCAAMTFNDDGLNLTSTAGMIGAPAYRHIGYNPNLVHCTTQRFMFQHFRLSSWHRVERWIF